MSRSKRPKCGTGRGCWCCGDAGASRRKREAAWSGADELPTLADPAIDDNPQSAGGHCLDADTAEAYPPSPLGRPVLA